MSEAGKEAARVRYRREAHQLLRLEFIKVATQATIVRSGIGIDDFEERAQNLVKLVDAILAAAAVPHGL